MSKSKGKLAKTTSNKLAEKSEFVEVYTTQRNRVGGRTANRLTSTTPTRINYGNGSSYEVNF